MISSTSLPPANATESVDSSHKPAVHGDRNARNVACALGGQKHHQVSELLRRAETSHGNLARPSSADLVGLPLQKTEDVQFYPLDMELRRADIVVGPADPVSIVGFPFGLAQDGGLPV